MSAIITCNSNDSKNDALKSEAKKLLVKSERPNDLEIFVGRWNNRDLIEFELAIKDFHAIESNLWKYTN